MKQHRQGFSSTIAVSTAILWAILSNSIAHAQAVASPAASHLRTEDHRIADIAYRLAAAGADSCPEAYPLTGLLFHHLAEYGADDRRLLIAAYGLDRGPGVLSVVAGSPAAYAGLIAGDVLLAANDKPFPDASSIAREPRREIWRAWVSASEALLEEQLRRGPVRLAVLRSGQAENLTLGSISACPARVRLARSVQVNGFVSGRYVIMTTGMLGFIRSDDELALVLGHELAHLILRHTDRLAEQNVPRGLLRGFGKNASRVRSTEEEADRLGLRLASAAGFDVSAAIPFWRRFYRLYDGPQLFRTHPTLGARERIIEETLAELAGAQTSVRSDHSSGKARFPSVERR